MALPEPGMPKSSLASWAALDLVWTFLLASANPYTVSREACTVQSSGRRGLARTSATPRQDDFFGSIGSLCGYQDGFPTYRGNQRSEQNGRRGGANALVGCDRQSGAIPDVFPVGTKPRESQNRDDPSSEVSSRPDKK